MSRRANFILMASMLGIAAAYQLVFLRHGIGLIDEGHLANAALRISKGEVLYRDIYSVYPPGSFYVVAGLFDLFGTSLIVVRAFHVFMTLALALTGFAVARLLMASPWALLAGLLIGATGWEAIVERCHYAYLYSVFPIAALGGLSGILFAREKRSRRFGLIVIGGLAGLTLAFRLVPFVALSVAATAMIALHTRSLRTMASHLGWIIGGGLLVIAPVGIAFVSAAAGPSLFISVFWTSIDQYLGGGEFNLPFPALRFMPHEWSRSGLGRLFINWEFYLPLAIYFGAAFDFARALLRGNDGGSSTSEDARKARARSLRFALAIFGGVLFLRATGRSDYYHLAPVLVPAYLLGTDFLARGWTWTTSGRGDRFALVVVAALLLTYSWIHDLPDAAQRALTTEGSVALTPGGPRVAEAGVIDDLVADLRTRTQENEPILVLPWYPVVYFLADRPNPTRYDWLFPGYLRTESERADFRRDIEESDVEVLVYAPAAIDGDPARRLAGFEPGLDRVLRQRYQPVARYGRFIVMTRRPR